jgi:translation initiation factor IF-1
MVKNTIGGKNFKKGKKGGRKTKNPTTEFNTEDGLHFYGQVKSRIGGNTLDVTLQTGETVHATIPGRFIKKVWFNKDDLIVVRQEGNFYDIVQKVTNPTTMLEASVALNIKLDKDNSNLFRADIDELEDSDGEEEVEMSKSAINAKRREKDKERDLKRREGEIDTFDRVISVVQKGESASGSESDEEEQDEMGNTRIKKSSSVKSSSVKSSSTKSTESTISTQSSESDDEEIELFKPVPSKKKAMMATSTPVVKKATATAPKTPEKQITGTPLVAPDAPKKKIYRETPEEIAKMMGF